RLAPDVLVALAEPPAIAMKKATREIPIVFASLSNPIAAGLVSSLNSPGGNATGVAWEVTPEITAKSVEIMKDLLPSLRRLAVLRNSFLSEAWDGNIKDASRRLGVAATFIGADSSQALDDAFRMIAQQRFDAMFVLLDPLTFI